MGLLYGAHRLWAQYRTMTEQAMNTSNSDPSHPALRSSPCIRTSLIFLCNKAPSATSCWWHRCSCPTNTTQQGHQKHWSCTEVPSQVSCHQQERDIWCWQYCEVLWLLREVCWKPWHCWRADPRPWHMIPSLECVREQNLEGVALSTRPPLC